MKIFNKQLVFVLMLMCWAGVTWARPVINKPAPAFSAQSVNGQTVNLSDFRGKTVVLEWTNHQCPFVKKHYGSDNMQSLQRQYTRQGVVWLTIISSAPGKQGYVSAEKAKQLTTQRNAAPSDILLDSQGTVGKLYGAKTTPHMYIIDGEGVLRYMGGIDSIPSADKADIAEAVNYVKTGLDELSAGKPISQTVSRPYGCSIKY